MENNFWKVWSKFWDELEQTHFNNAVLDKIIGELESPVLIIGAGQGWAVKYLLDKGFDVTGIDNCEEMIESAKFRFGVNIINSDAQKLPFFNKTFNTVIIASGVVDFLTDNIIIKNIFKEALRVLNTHKNLYISFYKLNEKIERIYRKLGIITDKHYYMKRALELGVKARRNPFLMSFTLKKWRKKSLFSTILFWSYLGLFFPDELRKEEAKITKIYDKAEKEGIPKEKLIEVAFEKLPYRSYNEIIKFLFEFGLYYNEIISFEDSYLVRIKKSYLIDFLNNKNVEEVDDNWYLKTKDLTIQYRNSSEKALDKVNIVIKKGEIFGLLGPNGAGKTTFLSLISGLLKPNFGEIIFFYLNCKNMRQKIGFIPQDLALYLRLTAEENLYFFGRLYRINKDILKERVSTLLKITGLWERKDEQVYKFSSGMLRRLNLAIGLINEPELILMDEPTVGIDPQSRNKIYELIMELKKKGNTIIYTTHYMEEALKLCDRIAIIDRGKILLQGNPYFLLQKYGLIKISFRMNLYNKDFINELKNNKDIFLEINHKDNIIEILSLNNIDRMILINTINKVSKKYNLELCLLNIKEPSLEDLFLEITGRSLRDEV